MKKLMYILPLITILVVSACGYKDYGGYTYEDFEHLDDWEETDALGEDDYAFLYVYDRDFKGTSCMGCDAVNEDLFKFLKEGDHGKDYNFINARGATGTRPPHISDRAPRLYIIQGDTVIDVYPSAREILEFIKEFNNGDFSYEDWYTYEDFAHLDDWEETNTLGEDDYEFLYVYDQDYEGTSCMACDAVNEDLFKFLKLADHAKASKFINLREVTGTRPPHISHTAPGLYIIKDQSVVDVYASAREILDFIDTYENDDYTWPEATSD